MIEYRTTEWLWKLSCRLKGSVIPHALIISIPSSLLGALLVFWREINGDFAEYFDVPILPSAAWAALAMPLTILIAFRTRQALGRFWEGNGLLHAMRGEWFDSASCLVTFTMPAKKKKPQEVKEFRHTLVRLMSLCHGSALDEIKDHDTETYEVLDLWGLSSETMEILRNCKKDNFNRVEVILHMIQVLVINACQHGVIDVPSPILSRVYQTLSRGFVNLLNARKLKDTQFPFPYAQLISIMLLVFALMTPWVLANMVTSKLWCAVLTFMPVFALLCLNYIAGQLEMPFGDDPNDLPLEKFQEEMNTSLLMFIHENSDHVASTRRACRRSFSSVAETIAIDFSDQDQEPLSNNKKSMFLPPEEFADIAEEGEETEEAEPGERVQASCSTGTRQSYYGFKHAETANVSGKLHDPRPQPDLRDLAFEPAERPPAEHCSLPEEEVSFGTTKASLGPGEPPPRPEALSSGLNGEEPSTHFGLNGATHSKRLEALSSGLNGEDPSRHFGLNGAVHSKRLEALSLGLNGEAPSRRPEVLSLGLNGEEPSAAHAAPGRLSPRQGQQQRSADRQRVCRGVRPRSPQGKPRSAKGRCGAGCSPEEERQGRHGGRAGGCPQAAESQPPCSRSWLMSLLLPLGTDAEGAVPKDGAPASRAGDGGLWC